MNHRGEKPEDAKVQEIDERDIENVNLSRSSSVASGWGKRKDSYNYFNSVQMLGMHKKLGIERRLKKFVGLLDMRILNKVQLILLVINASVIKW